MKTNFIIIFFLILFHSTACAERDLSSSAEPPKKTLISELQNEGFYPYYKKYLIKHKLLSEKKEWSLKLIGDLNIITKAARPNRKFYNNSILWYGKGKDKVGFRPIDTPTDCDSGCTPVVFHLVLNAFGETLGILEEDEPLRKKWHVPFTQKDKDKLLKLCKEFPKKLSIIEHPLELTEPVSKQTWTFYSDVLIKDGAYTSFVVYNTAKMTKDFIMPSATINKKEEEEKSKLTELFKEPINSEKDILDLLVKMKKLGKETSTLFVKKVLLENMLKATYYLLTGHGDSVDSKKKKELITNYFNPFSEELSTFLQNSFLTFLNNLVRKDSGREFLILLEEEFKGWNKIPQNLRSFLPFLSQGLSGNLAYLKKSEKNIDKEKLFKFSSQNSFFLICFTKAFHSLNNKDLTLKAYATLLIRFPKADLSKVPSLPKAWLKFLEAHKNKEIHEYTKELTKEFYPLNKKVPEISGFLPYNKDKETKIPREKDGKQIYIFFAPWCAHCHELIKTLGETMPKSFWEKVQLISVFSDEKNLLESFVNQTNLKENAKLATTQLVMLREDKKTKDYYNKTLNLYAVPKVILTNKKGYIIDFSFDLEPHPEKDLNRDLNLIFSSLL